MSTEVVTSWDRREAEALIHDLDTKKKPTWPVRTEILTLALQISGEITLQNRAEVQAALNELRSWLSSETPKEIRELFAWTQSDLMQAAPDIANTIMEERMKLWKWPPLTAEQKVNIKQAIIARIADGNIVDILLSRVQWGMSTLMSGIKDIFQKEKIEAMAKSLISGSATESWPSSIEATITKEVMKMVDIWLSEIQKAHESEPRPNGYEELLRYPQLLAKYSYGNDILTLIGTKEKVPKDREGFLESVKAKLSSMDKRISGMQKDKESIFDILAKLPSMWSDTIFEAMKWLFSIPIFWTFARWFIGMKGSGDPIEYLKAETDERRLVLTLQEYGRSGKKRDEIPLLGNIDLKEISYKELRPLFKKFRDAWIDTKKEDLWKKIFTEGKITWERAWSQTTLTFPPWERGKESLSSIIEKLSQSPETPMQNPPNPQEKPDVSQTSEAPNRLTLIKKWLTEASSLPFRAGNEEISFSAWVLKVWSSSYRLEGVGMLTVDIESLVLKWNMVVLGHRFGTSTVEKSDVIDALPELLVLGPWSKTEIKGEDGKLRVTRTA